MAAARGGFTTVCGMPNTAPSPTLARPVEYIQRTAAGAAARVMVIGRDLEKARQGRESATAMGDLADAGAVAAFSDDGRPVSTPPGSA